MWIRTSKYPVIANTLEINRNDQFLVSAIEMARIPDNTQENVTWVFVNHNGVLSKLYVAQWTNKLG